MGATIVVGVAGGIAAFKAVTVVRELERRGHRVIVVPTPASLAFVGRATWEAVSSAPVHTGVFDAGGANHVEIARMADLILVVPATADLLARVRAGRADDLLATTILAATCPVVLAPAMHSAMWGNAATRNNVEVLRERGLTLIEPASGALGSGDSGVGRLPEPEVIVDAAEGLLAHRHKTDASASGHDLAGTRVVITAGGTREPLDPVRFLGNRSSGRQGIALARRASARGATVTLIVANIEGSLLSEGGEIVEAPTAADMERAVGERLEDTDVLIMAAAVADFRPKVVAETKIKKDPRDESAPTIELERTPDILAGAASAPRRPRIVVGFGAETGTIDEVLARGRAKARRKGADLLAVNAVGRGRGFGDVENTLHLLDSAGGLVDVISGTKQQLADGLLSHVAGILRNMES